MPILLQTYRNEEYSEMECETWDVVKTVINRTYHYPEWQPGKPLTKDQIFDELKKCGSTSFRETGEDPADICLYADEMYSE